MGKQLYIDIPKPCHEDWNKMTPSGKGRFCGSCQKQVIDFGNMSDREIAQFFKKPSNGSICGRFMEDQLNRNISIPKKRIPWIRCFLQFVLPTFLATVKVDAQVKPKPVVQQSIPYNKQKDVLGQGTKKEEQAIEKKNERQQSRSVLEDTVVLPEVTIISSGLSVRGKVVLGYTTMVNTCDFTTALQGKMGGVVAGVKVKQEDTLFTKVLNFLTQGSRTYPNPVVRGQGITIECYSDEDKVVQLIITNVGGQIISTQSRQLNKGMNNLQVIPGHKWSTGMYIIQLIGEKGRTIREDKIIVQ